MTHPRWYYDPGAIPGEPCAYLDAPTGQLDYASAFIVELDSGDPDQTAYHAILGPPDPDDAVPPPHRAPVFSTLTDAYTWAESRVPLPLSTIPIAIYMEIEIQERYRPQPGEVLIAITEPGRAPIVPLGTFAATYHLAAWDLPYHINHQTYGEIGPITRHDALPLLEFVLRHRNTLSKLVLYCHAGIARSPAVAIALSEWLPTDPHPAALIERYPCFNRAMYRTLCQAAIDEGLLRT
ncbi:MAG: hypothetical protein Q8S75_09555 [Nitrospirota bacterium]|nr:hypothetical protein [Nitrospirota bacterium]